MNEPKIQQGQSWLETLLNLIALPVPVSGEVKRDEDDEDEFLLTIDHGQLSEGQLERLIGDRGATIDAMQYLLNITLNHGIIKEEQHHFTVDVNGYRAGRLDELKAIANEVALRVQTNGHEEAIENLSSAERRQMHTFLKDFADLSTESRGQEPHRSLVVSLRQFD